MKYNINQLDKDYAKLVDGHDGKRLKDNLKTNISEQEKMLGIFENSVNHCNKQISLCVDKIAHEQDDFKRQEYETQKYIFEDNKLIWNISGFITLVSIDIKTMQIGMNFAETEWQKRFYARQICTVMYESSNDILELLGKDFKSIIAQRINITSFEHDLEEIKSKLSQFKAEHSEYLRTVRNNTSAHKDKDILKQIDIISGINWTDTLHIAMKFEGIINALGGFLQKVINIGLANLEDSPLGQKRI